jgi:beta-galactosidase
MKQQPFHFNHEWETVETTALNRELSHVAWGAYEDEAQAATLDVTASRFRQSLDGIWKFSYKDKPSLVEPFYGDDYSHAQWSDIRVPGNWELQGFGEPIYTNTLFPWDHFRQAPHILRPLSKDNTPEVRGLPNPPHLPPENPTGCYFRTFTIPAGWEEREVFLHFKGVETACYLWINGHAVGYSEDSKLPFEFNITAFLRPGENTVALQVMRFATSTYLEDQDYWYLSGIFRSVFLMAKPKLRLVDWKIDAVSDRHHPLGTLQADVAVNQLDGFADTRVKVEVRTMADEVLAVAQASPQPRAAYRTAEQATAGTARVNLTLPDITPWTPETPVLYKVIITLLAADGSPIDHESCRVGFKRVEIENGILLLNGRRLLVRGVNRHEHEPHGGRTVSREHMEKEIRLMKQLGINAVRTCHYPDDPIWYDLCDEWGLLTICECNLETHGVMGALTHNPAWATNFLERAVRMVLTHKNHASVYSWSLGNESGTGANHAAMYGWIKEYDPTRICQYEAGQPGRNVSDVRGNMYAPPAWILNMLTDPDDTRPIILVEYLYQIRNAGGGMHHFNELLERHPRFQGGDICDWQDKCLVAKTGDGTPFFGYGGDFGESVTDWECPLFMTNNGIVLPDLTPKRWRGRSSRRIVPSRSRR